MFSEFFRESYDKVDFANVFQSRKRDLIQKETGKERKISESQRESERRSFNYLH